MFHIQQSNFFIRPSLLNLILRADFRISCGRIKIIRPLLFSSEARCPKNGTQYYFWDAGDSVNPLKVPGVNAL